MLDEFVVDLSSESVDTLERRAQAAGCSAGEYVAALLERAIEGFEMNDSVESNFQRRLAEVRR